MKPRTFHAQSDRQSNKDASNEGEGMRILITLLIVFLALSIDAGGQEPHTHATARLVQYLHTRSLRTGFSGAVLVTHNGEVLLREAFGYANRELKVPLTVDHIFRIGSLTKPITAAAVVLLAEKDKLKLDDSVCKYLRVCPEEWNEVALKHLLSQTSGIPDLFGDLESAPVRKTAEEIDRLLIERKSVPLKNKPGVTSSYSNFNYMLLGYVIETASGKYWEDYLIDSFFKPLGMKHTRYDDVWAIVEGRATGYGMHNGVESNIEYDDHSAFAAGGLRSTLDDLQAWHNTYIDDRIISREGREASTAPFRDHYGLGWQVLHLFGRRMYNHTGGIDGFSSHLAYYPDEDLLIIVLSNFEKEDSKATACDLAAIVLNSQPLPSGDAQWLKLPREERCKIDDNS